MPGFVNGDSYISVYSNVKSTGCQQFSVGAE